VNRYHRDAAPRGERTPRAVSAMVSTLDADTLVIDGLTAVRQERSALGKSKSESHVLEFRR
jgi:hypothetical protein